MANDSITIDLDINDGKATATITNFRKKAEKEGQATAKEFVKGILAADAIKFAGRQFVSLLSGAIQGAMKQEDAVNRLNQSLFSAGRFSKQASADMQEFAAQMQSVTIVGEETTMELLAMANNMARSSDEAKKMVKAALDLSAATGMSADSAVKNLGKSLGGLSGELGESINEIRGLTAEQLKAGGAIDLVASKFAGFAASQRNTFSGAMAAASNAFGDILKNIGLAITKSPIVVGLINKLGDAFGDVAEKIKTSLGNKDVMKSILLGFVEFAKGVNFFLVTPIEAAVDTIKLVFHGLKTAIFGAVLAITEPAEQILKMIAPDSALAQGLESFNATAKIAFDDTADAAKDAINSAFGFEATTTVNDFLDNMGGAVEELSKKNGQLRDQVQKTGEDVKYSFDQINSIIRNSATQFISQGIQSIVTSLMQGGNAFKSFAQTSLNILGDFAIQLGTFIISSSSAINALKASLLGFSGAPGIAAGIALIAIGAALKSFAGGPSATNAANAGPSVNQPLPVTPVETAPTEEQVVSPTRSGPRITLNIQGNVLDRRETGLEIAEILKETFQTNDVAFA